jgi:hypothetical protein
MAVSMLIMTGTSVFNGLTKAINLQEIATKLLKMAEGEENA